MPANPETLKKDLLLRMGAADTLAARAQGAAGRLAEAADHAERQHRQEQADLEHHIQSLGVGEDPEAEKRYCTLLQERRQLQQAHELAKQDAGRIPDVKPMPMAAASHEPRATKKSLSSRLWAGGSQPHPADYANDFLGRAYAYLHSREAEERALVDTGFAPELAAAQRAIGDGPSALTSWLGKPGEGEVRSSLLRMLTNSALAGLVSPENPPVASGTSNQSPQAEEAQESAPGAFSGSDPDIYKGMPKEWVPPDMPREGKLLPLNGLEDREKFAAMLDAMRRGKWKWDVPLVRCGKQLLTGSHRFYAAQEHGSRIPTVTLDSLFRQAGLDFRALWKEHHEPLGSWQSNLCKILPFLPPELTLRYGIDLG